MSQARYKKMNICSVLFDLDGTLLDTIPDLASACNAMRIDLGLPALPEERIATFVGKGSENLVRRALTDLPNPPPTTPRHWNHFITITNCVMANTAACIPVY